MRTLAVALLLTALPVAAQTAAPVADSAGVDPVLVGTWTLERVETPGAMASYGAELDGMVCTFTPEGRLTVALVVEQDLDRYTREGQLEVVAEDGLLASADGSPMGAYELLDGGVLRLRLSDGLVARLRPAR